MSSWATFKPELGLDLSISRSISKLRPIPSFQSLFSTLAMRKFLLRCSLHLMKTLSLIEILARQSFSNFTLKACLDSRSRSFSEFSTNQQQVWTIQTRKFCWFPGLTTEKTAQFCLKTLPSSCRLRSKNGTMILTSMTILLDIVIPRLDGPIDLKQG